MEKNIEVLSKQMADWNKYVCHFFLHENEGVDY